MADSAARLVVLGSERDVCSGLARAFTDAGFHVYAAEEAGAAAKLIRAKHPDVLVFSTDGVATEMSAFLAEAQSHGRGLRVFTLADLPYDPKCQSAAAHGSKLITHPLPIADVVKVVCLNLSSNARPLAMTAAISDIVRDALKEVLGFYLTAGLQIGNSEPKAGTKIAADILAVIPLTGTRHFGTVALCFENRFGRALAAGMLGDAEAAAAMSDHEIVEVVSETANQLAGGLQGRLIAGGLPVNIGLPKALSGKALAFVHPGLSQVATVRLDYAFAGRSRFARLLDRCGWSKGHSTVEFCFDEIA
jgi:CheY-specific phosphatase CheX